MISNILKL